MLTPPDILRAFSVLEALGVRPPWLRWDERNRPFVDEDAQRLAIGAWREMLDDLDGPTLGAAVKAHVNDPVAGKRWPMPADLRAALGATSPAALVDLDDAAWAMLQTVRRGESVRGRLGPEQFRALESIGGMWAVTTAEGDVARATLRRRFIDAARAFRAQAPQLVAIEGGRAPRAIAAGGAL